MAARFAFVSLIPAAPALLIAFAAAPRKLVMLARMVMGPGFALS